MNQKYHVDLFNAIEFHWRFVVVSSYFVVNQLLYIWVVCMYNWFLYEYHDYASKPKLLQQIVIKTIRGFFRWYVAYIFIDQK